jgi:hypothetical protein
MPINLIIIIIIIIIINRAASFLSELDRRITIATSDMQETSSFESQQIQCLTTFTTASNSPSPTRQNNVHHQSRVNARQPNVGKVAVSFGAVTNITLLRLPRQSGDDSDILHPRRPAKEAIRCSARFNTH